MGNFLQAFFRQHSNEYVSPTRNSDCLSDSQKNATDKIIKNERLVCAPICTPEMLAFLRQHSNEYVSPTRNSDCLSDSQKNVTDKIIKNERLVCEPICTPEMLAFLRQHSNEYVSPTRNSDCLSDSQKNVTDKIIQNEELLCEPICTPEIVPCNKNDVFKTYLNITVEEKRIKEWEAQKNCDIEITCGEFRTNAHRVVLSSVSDYFKANTKFNKHKWSISLNEEFVSSDALNDVINFAYTGRLEISTNRLQDVIATASYLQVTFILDACERRLIKNVDFSGAISLFPFAIRFDLTNLIDCIIQCLSKYFETYVDQNAFCSLSNDEFKLLLMNKNLSVFRKGIPVDNPELHILEAVGKTLTKNQINDIQSVKDILSAIRFSEIPKVDLTYLYNSYHAFMTLDEISFLHLKNNVLRKREFSQTMKGLENSKACAKNPHRKLPDQFKFVRYFEEILDINDRPKKIGLWITRWEGYIDIGGIQIEYKSGKSVLHGVRPKAKHSILSEHEFELDEAEVITNINLRAGMLLDSISFDTNYDRTYGPYGSNGGYPSSSFPSQKRGYFHSFRGIVLKGRYDHFIANIECAWVVFKTHNTDNDRLMNESSKPIILLPCVRRQFVTESNMMFLPKRNPIISLAHTINSNTYECIENKDSLAFKF